MLADLDRPDHFFKNLVAMASREELIQVIGRSVMAKSQSSHGHTPALYRRSFCFLVTEVSSTLFKSLASFSSSCCLCCEVVEGTETRPRRNLMDPFSTGGMGLSCNCRCGLTRLAVDAWMLMAKHL